MSGSTYIIYFLIFSFIGWIIDSSYQSIRSGKLVNSGYFPSLPLCPVYGVGGTLLIYLFMTIRSIPLFSLIILGAIAMTVVEYIGGVFCVHVLKERLWDYRHMKLNIHGHVNILHSLYWTLLVIIFYYAAFPVITSLPETISGILLKVAEFDRVIIVLFFVLAFFLTKRQYHHRRRRKKTGKKK